MRSILYGFLLAFLILGSVEYAYRQAGGVPTVVPGKTALEFKYRVQEAKADMVVYVVGDSRVDWGFGDKLFSEQISRLQHRDIKSVNCGLPSGSTLSILNYIIHNPPNGQPGVIVLNFSPASFYHFKTRIGEYASLIKRQDFADHQINNYLSEKIFTFGQKVQPLYQYFQKYRKIGFQKRFGWFSRIRYPEGFVNSFGRNNDGSVCVPDPAYYRKLFQKIKTRPEYALHRRKKIIQKIHRATNAGWKVIMVRMPVGEEMRQLETTLPEDFKPEKFAGQVGLYYKDYTRDPRTMNLLTDGSHLVPDSARMMTKTLSSDFSRWLNEGIIKKHPRKILENRGQNGFTIRKADTDDKYDIFDVHRASVQQLIETGRYSENAISAWIGSMRLENYDAIFRTRDIVVATIDGDLVGFGQIDLDNKAIDSLHVVPMRHDYTVRLQLLKALEKIASQKSIQKITLFGSIDKIIFFKHHGYNLKEIKTVRFPNGSQFKHATMEKILL